MAENQSSRYVPNEFVMLSLTDFIISSSLISDRVTEYLVPFFRRYSELRGNNFSSIRSISLPYTKPFPIFSLVYRQSNPVIKKRREYERRCFLVLSAPFTAVAHHGKAVHCLRSRKMMNYHRLRLEYLSKARYAPLAAF